MKKYILILIITLYSNAFSQIFYNQKVDSLVNLVSLQSILKNARELTGDTLTTIGGIPYLIHTRFYMYPPSLKAAQYVYEKFQSYGLNTRYQVNDSTCVNVIGTKTGTKFPYQYFIICAHFDNVILNPYPPTINDTIPGADDNASGVSALLEAARLLTNFNTDYSLIFIAFDREEVYPPPTGSMAYVDSIFASGDTIRGVLNLDMIAYDGNNDSKYIVDTDTNSLNLAKQLISAFQIYQSGMPVNLTYNNGGSDHSVFWQKNYRAIMLIEDWLNDMTPYYHKKTDKVSTLNQSYWLKMTKSAIALFASWGIDNFVQMEHKQVSSCYDTAGRIISAYIKFPHLKQTGTNSPRLYYKLWDNPFNHTNPISVTGDTFKFYIPGHPRGSKIFYYFAAQDSNNQYVFTLPEGGGGINPTGTVQPPLLYSYYIWTNLSIYSSTTPRIITTGNTTTRDTIKISRAGTIIDVNVRINLNHTNDGDLAISLGKESNTSNLSIYNGQGGQNFTNTVFDDSASISITQGSPPFTGTFKPQTPLSVFNNKELSGNWILRIYDKGTSNTGTLLDWELEIIYAPSVSANNQSEPMPDKYILFQNYPNPFNSITNVKFLMLNSGFAEIKVYDITGKMKRVLTSKKYEAGEHIVRFDAEGLPSGVYFYKLTAGEYNAVKKMVLIR